MKNQQINVKTTLKNVQVSSHFYRELPESLDEAIQVMGEKLVFETLTRAIKIDLQAPARKFMSDIWDDVSDDEKEVLTKEPEKAGAQSTAIFPEPQRVELQSLMDEFTLGQRSGRVRVLKPADTVKYVMDEWDNMSPEKKAEMVEFLKSRMGA